jgi:hypothetical protein
MRKLIPFVVTMSLLLWWADVSRTRDEIVPVAPAAGVSLPKPLGGDRRSGQTQFLSKQTRLSHMEQEGGLHEVDRSPR